MVKLNSTPVKTYTFPDIDIVISQGDIVESMLDVIVNAANMWLLNGAGVTGAIFRYGGKDFLRKTDDIGYVPYGHSVLIERASTSDMPAPGVLHMSCPPWEAQRTRQCKAITRNAYRDCFDKVIAHPVFQSIAFPAIGTGVYGVPAVEAAYLAVASVNEMMNTPHDGLTTVEFITFDTAMYYIYRGIFDDMLQYEQEEVNNG